MDFLGVENIFRLMTKKSMAKFWQEPDVQLPLGTDTLHFPATLGTIQVLHEYIRFTNYTENTEDTEDTEYMCYTENTEYMCYTENTEHTEDTSYI